MTRALAWRPNRRLESLLLAGFLVAAYVYAHAHSPLYSSNQNAYFPHGLAQAGFGLLEHDFYAQTVTPYPVFDALVSLTYRLLGENFFYAYLIALKGLFLLGIMGVASHFAAARIRSAEYLVTAVIFISGTSAWSYFKWRREIGLHIVDVMGSGLAQQSVPGYVLQPSTFGVLLIVSIWLFLLQRRRAAVLSLVAAVWFHPTYLIAGAGLTLAYMLIVFLDGRDRNEAYRLGASTLVFVSPILIYGVFHFSASSPEQWQQAVTIIARERIPHHSQIARAFSLEAWLQLGFVATALGLVIRRRDGLVLWIPFALGLGLTPIQLLLDSDALALLFPWRVSVILVPVSFCLVTLHVTKFLFRQRALDRGWVRGTIIVASLLIVLAPASNGRDLITRRFGSRAETPEAALMGHVRSQMRSGDRYLIPANMKEFRLGTGAPTFVDWKFHPLKDTEVLEWHRRILLARRAYRPGKPCEAVKEIALDYQITFMIGLRSHPVPQCDFLTEVFRRGSATVHALEGLL